MSYSAITQPDTYSNGYSFIPIRLSDTDATTVASYKYIINIAYNGLTISSSTSYSYDGSVFTQLTFAENHEYAIGDIILLEDSTGLYTGYYIVLLKPSSTTVVIDLTLGAAMTGTIETSNVIKYKVNPDPDFEAKIDLSNTLKDFVTQDLEDSNDIFAAPNTKFDYDLKFGYEGNAIFNFDDNIFQGGSAGFVDASLTAVTQVEFNVGDSITIEQDLYEWDYDDNYFYNGRVGYTGSTAHNFASGNTITVTGQITNPSYNGPTTVYLSADTYGIVTYWSFLDSSPAEPGTIYGVITPEYNVTANITNIVYSAGTGVIIITDIPFARSTPAIGGTIKHADGRYVTSLDSLSITGLSVYNSYVNQLDYTIDDFDKYVCQFRSSTLNNISTILSGATKHRIEASTKSWLLAHNDYDPNEISPRVTFYDSSDAQISQIIYNNTSDLDDFYFPIGINQLTGNTDYTVQSGSELSAITSTVDYYSVGMERLGSAASELIWFEINNDCSRYELYHLMWKDARGSWLSFPFKYLSRDKTDVDRKNYYQTNGTWSSNSFGFDSYGRGERTYFARSRDKVTLNSGWLTEAENAIIKDLMQSAAVYIQTPDDVIIACTIDNKKIEFGKNINEQVFQYKLDIVYSNNEIRL
jgi:hypothetical protein